MPRFDGTGPSGAGPAGGGRGGCRTFTGYLHSRQGRLIGSVCMAVCGLVARDARNPDGLTRRSVRTLGNGFLRLFAGRRGGAGQVVMPPDETHGSPEKM